MKQLSINCTHKYTIYDDGRIIIALYSAENKIMLPDGTETTTFRAKSLLLPFQKGLEVTLTGVWTKYVNKKTQKTEYTFDVEKYEEILPTTKSATIEYLKTLDGVGKKTAEQLYDKFGAEIFTILEKETERITEIKGISINRAKKIVTSYASKAYAQELFQYLFPYKIRNSRILRIYKYLGVEAVNTIKSNPYILTNINGIGFDTAERIARKENIPSSFIPRIEAGIIEVLTQAETGGAGGKNVFSSCTAFPYFMQRSFLSEKLYKLMQNKQECNVTGGTYLPRDVVYLMTLKLLNIPITEDEFNKIAINMHIQKKGLFIYLHPDTKEALFYKLATAKAEFTAGKRLAKLLSYKLAPIENLSDRIDESEKVIKIKLSDEQKSAVKMALENPVSIITGGPGTGKTSVQKCILDVFSTLFPQESVLLTAPTGRAAKRMAENSGKSASTLHKALNLYTNSDGEIVSKKDGFVFFESLILVDESSMIGSLLFEKLISCVMEGTRLVFIGDVDQLPSIEVGAVLRELISCKDIPITRLTKTFRQASGSSIAINASRIKNGESTMLYNEDFKFIEKETSAEIANAVLCNYPFFGTQQEIDDTIVLSPYRKRTESGTNNLNELLRNAIRGTIAEDTPHFENDGIKIYEGDTVMCRKNTEVLTNGDIGVVKLVNKINKTLVVICNFDGKEIYLEDDEASSLELAYATTVHKSQGSESKTVILVCDREHQNMLKRNLIYTGITRAKQKLILIGQKDAFQKSIQSIDSNYRRSQLGEIISRNITINDSYEQISMEI